MRKLLLIIGLLGLTAGLAHAQAPSAYPYVKPVQNDTTTGTTQFTLTKINASGNAIIMATTDVNGFSGVCVANCGTTGTAWIAFGGLVPVKVDGTTTTDHYITISSSTAGDGHDTGATTYPTSGSAVIGRVQLASSGAASFSIVDLGPETQGTCLSNAAGQGDVAWYSASGTACALSGAGPGTSKQIAISGGTSGPSFIDFPDSKSVPFAVCVNGTAATGVTTTTAVGGACRAGTNNKDAYIGPFTTSDSVTFKVHLPKDWDTGTAPSLSVDVASTDATNAHTIILQAATECSKLDGSTTDDVAFNAAQAMGTITLGAGGANQTWTTTLTSLTTTGCSAPGIIWVKITRASDTATNVELYEADITIPRLLTVQAN